MEVSPEMILGLLGVQSIKHCAFATLSPVLPLLHFLDMTQCYMGLFSSIPILTFRHIYYNLVKVHCPYFVNIYNPCQEVLETVYGYCTFFTMNETSKCCHFMLNVNCYP